MPAKRTTKKAQPEEVVAVEVPAIDVKMMKLTIVGDTPVLLNRFSEKAKQQMLRKQKKEATQAKEAKDPEALFEAARHIMEDGRDGIPAVALKAAAVEAGRFVGANMTALRGTLHVVAEDANGLVPIQGPEPKMYEAPVRNATGVADLRYRPMYHDWSIDFLVRYNARMISPAQIINLFNHAGFGVGIGEWRPMSKQSKTGHLGLFHVATE